MVLYKVSAKALKVLKVDFEKNLDIGIDKKQLYRCVSCINECHTVETKINTVETVSRS